MSAALVPGSFDPVTLGHLDIIRRAAAAYDEVYAVIFKNPEKEYRFSLDERMRMLMIATDDLDNVLVSFSNGMVIDYMHEHEIPVIVKGYRNETDLAYEKKQADWNFEHGGVDTVLLPCDERLDGVSSTAVREKLDRSEDVSALVPAGILPILSEHAGK